MAAASKSRATAQAEGKKVPMHDENDMGDAAFDREAGDGEGGKGKSEVKDGGRAKGVPTNKKRSRSPEGGGVAGRDSKKSKNAYEISTPLFYYCGTWELKIQRARSLLLKMPLESMPTHH